MANKYSRFTYDNALLLRASANIASATTTTGATILDVGDGLIDSYLVLDVTVLDVASTDESYNIILEGSPDAAFGTAGNIKILGQICIGSVAGIATAVVAPQGAADGIGRFVVPFRNERNGTTVRYVRLVTVTVGTSPSITFSAFLAKDD